MADEQPDVVLLDAHVRSFDVVEAVRLVGAESRRRQQGGAPILVVLDRFEEDSARRLLRAGARGMLLDRASPAEIVGGVRLVAAGYALVLPPSGRRGSALPPGGSRASYEARSTSAPGEPTERPENGEAVACCLRHLTRREADVLRLIARGLSNAEISAALLVSESTVKSHVQRMLEKLELRNRVHAVIYAYEAGLVQSDPASR
ncbi:response regulator transcription factor [Streptomyces sp. B6B3]|uniref:response regulator transcription factor n=1 Tax=Streptomyces sp. B6B3 TaxID=3153570 RepID=UPI00325E10CD